MHNKKYLHYEFNHSTSIKTAITRNLYNRAVIIYNNYEDLNFGMQNTIQNLGNNSYPGRVDQWSVCSRFGDPYVRTLQNLTTLDSSIFTCRHSSLPMTSRIVFRFQIILDTGRSYPPTKVTSKIKTMQIRQPSGISPLSISFKNRQGK